MISKLSFVLFALSTIQVTAFPRLNFNGVKELTKIAKKSGQCPHLAKHQELKRQTAFDPTTQQVSTTGEYAWVAPGAGDQRGPCPGLNALANHGYIPHSGVTDIPTVVSAVNSGKSISFCRCSQICVAAFLCWCNLFPCALCLIPVSSCRQAIGTLLTPMQHSVWASILVHSLQYSVPHLMATLSRWTPDILSEDQPLVKTFWGNLAFLKPHWA